MLRVLPYLLLSLAPAAFACPFCHTPTGKQVRAQILDLASAAGLLATILPFPVLGAAVLVLHYGVPAFRRGPRSGGAA